MNRPEDHARSDDFGAQYIRLQSPVFRHIERSVCGCDYGGTSWTTQQEADRLCSILGLVPGMRLLEIGAGSGWPGLYVAQRSGCDLTMVDLPVEALRRAADRAVSDHLDGTCGFSVADAALLPFRSEQFHAISHSDVLCCLEKKREVLEDCRRVIGGKGIMAFTVISITPGLSRKDHDHAVEFGPPFVDAETGYDRMLRATGWCLHECEDLTQEYLATSRRYMEQMESRAPELRQLLGVEVFASDVERLHAKVDAINRGLFRRELLVATPGGPV